MCSYCAKLAAVENSEVLSLDALLGEPPCIWAVLTTPSTDRDPRRFYRPRENLVRALRRRWPRCEYSALLEFTTGYGPRSGGKRRPHWNLLLKGIPADALEEVESLVHSVWCPLVGGSKRGQHVGLIEDAGGLMRYIALHFQKESQAPPKGWHGVRFLKSKGYLWKPAAEARAIARQELGLKREIHKLDLALERQGHFNIDPMEIQEWAENALALRGAIAYELVKLPGHAGNTSEKPSRAPYSREAIRAMRERRNGPETTDEPPAGQDGQDGCGRRGALDAPARSPGPPAGSPA